MPLLFQFLLIEPAAAADEGQVAGEQKGGPRDPEQGTGRNRQQQKHAAERNQDLHNA
jgi:hypothetical protein